MKPSQQTRHNSCWVEPEYSSFMPVLISFLSFSAFMSLSLHPLLFQSCYQHDFKDGTLIACLSVCPPLWSRLKYPNNYKLYFYEPLQTFMVSRGGMQLTEYGTDIHERMTLAIQSFFVSIATCQVFTYSVKYLNICLIHWHKLLCRQSPLPANELILVIH